MSETNEEAREALTAIRGRLQNSCDLIVKGVARGHGSGIADFRALIEFIDAQLEADPSDDAFTVFALRAGCGHLGSLVDDLRAELAAKPAPSEADAILRELVAALRGHVVNFDLGPEFWSNRSRVDTAWTRACTYCESAQPLDAETKE